MIQIEVTCTTNFEFKHGSGAFLRFVKVVLYFVFILSAQLALGRFEADGLREPSFARRIWSIVCDA